MDSFLVCWLGPVVRAAQFGPEGTVHGTRVCADARRPCSLVRTGEAAQIEDSVRWLGTTMQEGPRDMSVLFTIAPR